MKYSTHLLLLALSSAAFSTAQAANYTVIDLGVGAGYASRATGVNNSGTVVGNIRDDTHADGTTTNSGFRYFYAGGVMETLRYDTPNLTGSSQYGPVLHHQTAAYAINNAGQVAGSIDINGWSALGAAAGSQGPYATIFQPDGSVDFFPGLEGSVSQALAINSAGLIAGTTWPNSVSQAGVPGIVDIDGSWHRIPSTGSYGAAFGMNDLGQTVGANGGFRTFLSTGGTTTLISNTLGGNDLFSATDINNNGVVVGSAGTTGPRHAYTYTESGGMVDLGALLPGYFSEALAINDSGLVVGSGASPNGVRALLWSEATGAVDLNTLLLNSSNLFLVAATAVSENGFIAGYGISSLDGQEHAFLLTPDSITSSVPEAGATACLMFLGLAGLAGVRRKVSRA